MLENDSLNLQPKHRRIKLNSIIIVRPNRLEMFILICFYSLAALLLRMLRQAFVDVKCEHSLYRDYQVKRAISVKRVTLVYRYVLN